MVQLTNLGKIRPHTGPPEAEAAAAPPVVKLEIEDPLEEEHGPLNKKPKGPAAPFRQVSLFLSIFMYEIDLTSISSVIIGVCFYFKRDQRINFGGFGIKMGFFKGKGIW